MAVVIFILLSSLGNTKEQKAQVEVPLNLEKMNLDESGRYLSTVFGEVTIERDVLYSKVENEGATEDLKMDIYAPKDDTETSRPLIIWIHGGGFTSGDKSGAEEICTDLAKEGYVCASINYRLKANPGADWDLTSMHTEIDTISALGYLRSNNTLYGIDSSRIFLAGDSAGGDIALNSGFTDVPIQPDADRGGIIGIINIYGSELWHVIDVNDPPVLTLHGTNDFTVSYQASVLLANDLDSEGHENDFITMYGIGHNYSSDYDEALSSISYFTNNRLQVLNGAPFTYRQKTKPFAPGDSVTISLERSSAGEGFKGNIKITGPEGWYISGDTAITDQNELKFSFRIPDLSSDMRMQLMYFDILDENDVFISRIAVPVQIINPVKVSVKKQLTDTGRETALVIGNLGQNKFTGGTVMVTYTLDGTQHRDIQQFGEVDVGGSTVVGFPDNLGEQADFEVLLNGGLKTNVTQHFISTGKTGTPITVDGSLDEWPDKPLFAIDKETDTSGYGWNGKDDLSANGYVQWDNKNLYIAVEVSDDVHIQDETPENIWQGDSIQIAIDPGAEIDENFNGYHELGFALNSDGSLKAWRWIAPAGFETGDISDFVDLKVVRNNNKTIYEAAIPWDSIIGINLNQESFNIGFSLVINENDGNGRRGYMEYMGGIGEKKDPGLFGTLTLN